MCRSPQPLSLRVHDDDDLCPLSPHPHSDAATMPPRGSRGRHHGRTLQAAETHLQPEGAKQAEARLRGKQLWEVPPGPKDGGKRRRRRRCRDKEETPSGWVQGRRRTEVLQRRRQETERRGGHERGGGPSDGRSAHGGAGQGEGQIPPAR